MDIEKQVFRKCNIVVYGNEDLRKKSVAVDPNSDEVLDIAAELYTTQEIVNWLGISAPQIGHNKRIILFAPKDTSLPIIMVNPEIIEKSVEEARAQEGCGSLPGVYAPVKRPKSITVLYFDISGNEQVSYMDGRDARTVQHEIDHLDGKLFIDHLSVQHKKIKQGRLNKIKRYGQRYGVLEYEEKDNG